MDINVSYSDGYIILTTLYRGICYQVRYLCYSKEEALERFKKHVLEEDSKIIREV